LAVLLSVVQVERQVSAAQRTLELQARQVSAAQQLREHQVQQVLRPSRA
jgi:hypothetical protein